MSRPLSYDLHISDPIPQNVPDRVPNGDRRVFSPLTTTLISGAKDAVLVDPPLTTEQASRVGDWVESSGKNLAVIYVTHGHGDHWFGTAPLQRRFPAARVLATEGTIAQMRHHGSGEFRTSFWDRLFPGQIPDTPVTATVPPGRRFELDGHPFLAIDVGHSDTDDTSVLHVPSIGLVAAGDVVYNGVHQYLREAAGDGIARWLRALDQVQALHPGTVICGHKDRVLEDSPDTIERTRAYLLDAQRLLAGSPTALEFFHAMLGLYPERLNPGALWSSATALLPGA
jgi:glyoxylase-like metal-dependent hydrolase (beta-lactamase superfamily II)